MRLVSDFNHNNKLSLDVNRIMTNDELISLLTTVDLFEYERCVCIVRSQQYKSYTLTILDLENITCFIINHESLTLSDVRIIDKNLNQVSSKRAIVFNSDQNKIKDCFDDVIADDSALIKELFAFLLARHVIKNSEERRRMNSYYFDGDDDYLLSRYERN